MTAPVFAPPADPVYIPWPTQPPPEPDQQQDDQHDGVIAAAVVVLAAWLGTAAAVGAVALPAEIVARLIRLGYRRPAVLAAARLGLSEPVTGRNRHGSPRPLNQPTMRRRVATSEPEYRAAYIAAASARLSDAMTEGQLAPALQREHRYLAQHRQAGIRRRAAAALYDAAAAQSRTGYMVWRTHPELGDVTPDCAALNGRIFHRDRPIVRADGRTAIPGAMHPRCHCTAHSL